MSGSRTTPKNARAASLAVFVTMLFLVSLMPTGVGQAGVTQVVTLSSTTASGDGAIVGFTLTQEKGKAIDLKVTPSLTLTATKVRSDATTDYYTGEVAFVSTAAKAPPGASAVTFGSTETTKTLTFPSAGAAETLTWTRTGDLQITGPTTQAGRTFWGTTPTTITIKDGDIQDCATQIPSIMYLDGHQWRDALTIDPADCTIPPAGSFQYKLSLPGNHTFSDGDRVVVGVLDDAAADGRPTIDQMTYTYRDTGTAAVQILRPDLNDVTGATIPSGNYLLFVRDVEADIKGTLNGKPTGSLDKVEVQVTSNVHTQPLKFTLTETGQNTGTFTKQIRIAPTTGPETVLVSGPSSLITVKYTEAPTDATATWQNIATPTITLTPSTNVVYTDALTVMVNDPFQPTGNRDLVVRTEAVYQKECSAATFDLAESTAASSPSCATLSLSGTGSLSDPGTIKLVPPGGSLSGACTGITGCTAILVQDNSLITVEYRDAVAPDGKKDQPVSSAATSRIWKMAFQGSISLDRDAYYVGETMTVRLVDPDQTTGTTRTITLANAGVSREITLTGGNGVFTGAVAIGTASGQFPAVNGDTISASYVDTLSPIGSPAPATAAVLEHPTGRATSDKSGVAGTDSFKLTLKDNNLDATQVPPYASSDSLFGSHNDTIHFKKVDTTTYEATVTSAYAMKSVTRTATLQSGSGPLGTGSCWYQIDLGEPIEPYGLKIENTGWKHETSGSLGTSAKEFQAVFRDGLIIIDSTDSLLNQPCPTRSDVADLKLTYKPAAKLVEEFIFDDITNQVPLGKHLTTPTYVGGATNPWGGETLTHMHFGDATPAQNGTIDGDHHVLMWKGPGTGNTAAAKAQRCAYITIEPSTITCDDVDLLTGVVTIKPTPEPGTVVKVGYHASGTVRSPAASTTLAFGPVLAGSLRDSSGAPVTASGADLTALVNDGTVPAGTTCPCLYRTDMFHDNALDYGSGIAAESGKKMIIGYVDLAAKDGVQNVPAGVAIAKSGTNNLFVVDDKGTKSRFFFGTSSSPTLELSYPQGDLDPSGFDTVTVSVDGHPATRDALGTKLETETVTLTETGLATGVFRGILPFETTQTANNGKLHVGSADSVQIDISHVGSGKTSRAWYYKTTAATFTMGGTSFFGSPSIPLTVSDADAGTRYVNAMKANLTENTPFRIKDIEDTPGVKPFSNINAIETSTVTAYVCNNSGECRILRFTDGSPGSAMPTTTPTSGNYVDGLFRVDSAGNIRHTDITGFTTNYVRVDFKAIRKDNAEVTPVVINGDGSSSTFSAVPLTETGSSTNVFTGQIAPGALGPLADDATVRFVYKDRTYAAIGNIANGCSPSATDCPGAVERIPGRDDVVIRDVTWKPSQNGILTIEWAGTALGASNLVVRGSEVVSVRLQDLDRNADPLVADSVAVDLLRGGSVVGSVQLIEDGMDSGSFVGHTTLSGWTSGATWDVRYADPVGANGQSITIRASDPSTISSNDMIWRPSDLATLGIEPARVQAKSGSLRVTLNDIDRNLVSGVADTVATTHFFITQDVKATTGTPVSSALTETSANSARFTGTWDLGTLTAGQQYFVVYKDPSDLVNQGARVVAAFETLPSDVNVPVFGEAVYESGSSLITLKVKNLTANDPRTIDVWYRSPADTTWTKGTPSLTLSSTGATSFTLVSTTGVTQLKAAGGGTIPLNSELMAVYHDSARGIGRGLTVVGSGAAQPVSEALITSGEKGKDDWYTSPPTASLRAKENENRLSGFQYRLNGASTQTCTDLPCSVTVTTEGINNLEYRALDLSGTPEQFTGGKQFNNLTVKYDATAPTLNVSALAAKSVKDGAIDLTWTGVPAGTPERDFAQYLVFRGSSTTPIGNTKEAKFVDSSLTEEGEYSYWVAIEDAAGHRGPLAGPIEGVSDKTPPAVSKVGVSSKLVVEGVDALRVDLFILLDESVPSDFDKAQVLVTPPAGGGNVQTIVLSANGLNYTGMFTNFNVSGNYAFSFQALDKAGNFQPFSETVRFKAIDRTPPIVEVPAQVEEGKSLTVTVKDNDAGIAAITHKLNGGTVQTVAVSGNPLEHKFTVATTGLALGDHTLEITAIDANGTADAHRNSATYTRTFEVVPKGTLPDDGGDDDTPIGNKPIIQAVSSLAEAHGDFRFRVSSNSLSALVVSFDGGASQVVLGDWKDAATPVTVSIGSLEAGKEHSARVTATNAAGTTTSDFTFFVLDEGIPLPPESVTPKKNKDGQPEITWTASPSSDVGGYLVHRAASPSKVIAVLGADALSFVDKTAKDGKTYAYAVTAYGTNGEGKLEEGADSSELAWFTHVQASTFKLDAEEPGITGLWWVFLILAVVIGGIAAVYVFRERLFKPRGEEEYEDEYPDEAASPFGVARHHLRCPNCTHEFSVSGQKPIVTTCPNCGKKGILR